MDPNLLEQINTASLIIFVVLAIAVLIRITGRYLRYKKLGEKVPDLLPRDFFLFAGLVTPFAGILFFRAFGIIQQQQWWYPIWIILSDTGAVFGMALWAYYEYFKVEKVNKK